MPNANTHELLNFVSGLLVDAGARDAQLRVLQQLFQVPRAEP